MWGCILGLAGVAYNVTMYLTHLVNTSSVDFKHLLMLGAISTVSVFLYRKKHKNGFLSFAEAFRTSYMLFLYAVIINLAYQFFYLKVIMTKAYTDEMLAKMTAQMQEKGLDERSTGIAISVARYFANHPFISLLLTGLSFVLIGAIISLIVAAICKRTPPEEFPQSEV